MAPRSPRLCGLSGLMGDLKDMGGALWGGEAGTGAGTGEGIGGGGRGEGGVMPRRQQSAPQLHREISPQQHASRWGDNQRADERYPQPAERTERTERTRKRTPPLSPSAQPAHGLYSMSGLYSLTAVDEGSPRAQRRAEL